ncbi:hypothetical protein [Bacillus sp. FJAT-27445]|uniref:hypothetical protein n=1 Tax=Bacillus sp. FJAT-27445 TaxID=1679166 RepID=UPI000AA854C2|nr:hypothetical protein [Bacillus sp. FJAT-27445]
MHNLINFFERMQKVMSENIARSVERSEFLKIFFGGIFTALMAVALKPSYAFAASYSWCQVTKNECDCNPPLGRYCGSLGYTCTSGSKCPSGCTVNDKYYPSTGCWCAAAATCSGTYVCCDCWCGGKECGCKSHIPGAE